MSNSNIGLAVKMSALYRSLSDILDLPDLMAESDTILLEASSDKVALSKKKSISPIRNNYDYGEVWPQILDDYRSGKIKTIVNFLKKKKKVQKDASYLGPIDSYCSSKKNVAYWEQLLDGHPNQAVEDFIEYIKQVSCSMGDK